MVVIQCQSVLAAFKLTESLMATAPLKKFSDATPYLALSIQMGKYPRIAADVRNHASSRGGFAERACEIRGRVLPNQILRGFDFVCRLDFPWLGLTTDINVESRIWKSIEDPGRSECENRW